MNQAGLARGGQLKRARSSWFNSRSMVLKRSVQNVGLLLEHNFRYAFWYVKGKEKWYVDMMTHSKTEPKLKNIRTHQQADRFYMKRV